MKKLGRLWVSNFKLTHYRFMIVLGNHKQNPDANEVKKIPLLLKLVFTLLFIVTIPSNIIHYSAINLLWFCDIAIITTFFGIWFESSLLVSMAALGSVATQLAWQVDYFFHLASGNRLFGFSDYMFDPNLSAFNKAVSLFHVWMPYVLLYSLRIVCYNRWALIGQTMTGSIAILLSFLLTKDMFGPAGNLNKVYGLSDKEPQTWVAPWLWLIVVMAYCFCVFIYQCIFCLHGYLKSKGTTRQRIKKIFLLPAPDFLFACIRVRNK